MEGSRRTKVVKDPRKTKVVGEEQLPAWLVPRSGKQAGEIFALKARNVVGADPETCHVVLDEEHVSSRHAEVTLGAGGWSVRDLESTNGTRVNEDTLQKGGRYEGLADGDVIVVGTLKVTFKCA